MIVHQTHESAVRGAGEAHRRGGAVSISLAQVNNEKGGGSFSSSADYTDSGSLA